MPAALNGQQTVEGGVVLRAASVGERRSVKDAALVSMAVQWLGGGCAKVRALYDVWVKYWVWDVE